MGASYLTLNILVCGAIKKSEDLINKLFPEVIQGNKRKWKDKDDKLEYTATIFRDKINDEIHLNNIKKHISDDFDNTQNEKNACLNDVVLYFSKENESVKQNLEDWIQFINAINTLPALKLPFIILLSFASKEEIENLIQNDIFSEFQDKRKIAIIRLLKGEDEMNYRKILSYLWRLTLILNQKPFKLSKNPKANLYDIRAPSPVVTINIMLTGFSRKGKSTLINMIFDRIVTLENPSFLPVTSEIIEFLLPGQPDKNGSVNGGIKVYDIPGLIEGTNENMKDIEKMVQNSIENQAYNFDIINYILFFLSPAPNFTNISSFLEKLNKCGIKVVFIINRDHPQNNGRPNITKQTLIDYLRSKKFNNLLRDEGHNILEVDIINGVEGRTNEIFRYLYKDITNGNNFDDNAIERIHTLRNQQLYPYLHKNFDFFKGISSTEDLIERGIKRAKIIIGATAPLIVASGFCPIPFVDIPIFLLLTALMLIKIFNSFGFNVDNQIFMDFFEKYNKNYRRVRNGINENERITIKARIFKWLNQNFENSMNEETKYIINELIRAFEFRLGIAAFMGIFDFIPGAFIITGVINSIINTPFIKKIAEKAQTFLINKIRLKGGKQNILNIIEGYKSSISVLERLSNKNDWSRKMQVVNA